MIAIDIDHIQIFTHIFFFFEKNIRWWLVALLTPHPAI